MNIEQEILGFIGEGEAIVLYTMTNTSGARVRLLNLGATIVSVEVPDKEEKLRDVVLGFKMYESYMNDGAALGKSVGRYANRIARGRFSLNGVDYKLAINNGVNHLHGGPTGFMNRVWTSRVETDRVVFSYVSAPGEEGYPGELGVEAVYDFDDDNTLEITYFAKGDADTIVNLTNHTYFNLNGECSGNIYSHRLQLEASRYLPVDETQIPTGERAHVRSTPMDFTAPKEIGREIDSDFEQIKIGHGYDHCWCVDDYKKGTVKRVAELYSAESGINLEVLSTQPGVQVYTGNWLDGCGISKTGVEHKNRTGVAIECQNFPDSPNKPDFPSPVLKADDVYEEHIQFKFSVK